MFFGFWLARTALRSIGRAKSNSGIPADQVKPTPVGPVTIATIVGFLTLVVGSFYEYGKVPSWITAGSLLLGVMVLGSLFIRGVSENWRRQDALARIPNPENMVRTAPSASQMRARAAELTSAVITIEQPPAAPPAPPVAVPAPRSPRIQTRRQILSDGDLDLRLRRIAAILIVECPVCRAGEAEFCKMQPGEAVCLLDRERGITVHGQRIGKSVKLNIAKITDVVAQFDNRVPDSVWEAAL